MGAISRDGAVAMEGEPSSGASQSVSGSACSLAAAEPSSTRGSIVLARHGEPALSRKIRLDAKAYGRWWAAYEEGGILGDQAPPPELLELARQADVIFASTRRRAVETAEAVAGGKTFVRDPLFVEAPLPHPPTPAFVRLSPKIWGFMARALWWFFGLHRGQETRPQAQARARAAAAQLVETAQDGRRVLLVAHGFFNTMVGLELRQLGWTCVQKDRGFAYWTTRHFQRQG